MTIRELQKRDKLEQTGESRAIGRLADRDRNRPRHGRSVGYPHSQSDEFRTTSEHRTTEPTGDTLSAIIVRVWLPDEEEIWRLTHVDTEPERIEPLQPEV